MSRRVILHHGSDPRNEGRAIDERVVAGCWFEWHRQGGCGPGELKLERTWAESSDVLPGDWISIGTSSTDRWYLGRVDEWRATYPAGVSVRLAGMVNELNELFPGGFGPSGIRPERHGQTDRFFHDPDHGIQDVRPTQSVTAVVEDFVREHVEPRSHITNSQPIVAEEDVPVDSMTLRGEESIRSLLKDLAVRAGGVPWGVDQYGEFFFRPPSESAVAEFRLAENVLRCAETRDRDVLFNRLQMTGDFVYDRQDDPLGNAQRAYRYRKIFTRDESVSTHGEHRIRLLLPWIRTDDDARRFVEGFFHQYASPASRFLIEAIVDAAALPIPWNGRVILSDEQGDVVASGFPSVVRVQFDACPTVRMELGPEDPRRLWAEPNEDERYEIATPEIPTSTTSSSTSEDESSEVPSSAFSESPLPTSAASSSSDMATSDWPTSWTSWDESLGTSDMSFAETSAWTSEDLSSAWSSVESSTISSAENSGSSGMVTSSATGSSGEASSDGTSMGSSDPGSTPNPWSSFPPGSSTEVTSTADSEWSSWSE